MFGFRYFLAILRLNLRTDRIAFALFFFAHVFITFAFYFLVRGDLVSLFIGLGRG